MFNKHIVWNDDNGAYYVRITKREARKLWRNKEPFTIIPCNIRPFNPFFPFGMTIDANDYERYENEGFQFCDLVNNFEVYNCNHEMGYYPAFYVMLPFVDPAPYEETLRQLVG